MEFKDSMMGFPCGSASKESICNAGDLGSTLDWKDTLEKGKATHSSILAWKIPRSVAKSWTRLSDLHSLHFRLGVTCKEGEKTA